MSEGPEAAEFDKETKKRPTLKQLFTGTTLNGYIEAAKIRSLDNFIEQTKQVEKPEETQPRHIEMRPVWPPPSEKAKAQSVFIEEVEIDAWWGPSPRSLPALWVQVLKEGVQTIRGYQEMRAASPEVLESAVREKLRDAIVEANLPVTAALRRRAELVAKLMADVPRELRLFSKCQLWSKDGIMLTAQLTQAEADEMVKSGKAKRINDQAIQYIK